MPKYLPILTMILAAVLLLAAIMLLVENASLVVDWQLGQQIFLGQSVAYPMAVTGLLMAAAVGSFAWGQALRLKVQGKRANRELERQNVTSEAAENRIEILEGQVSTLEAALERALKTSFPKKD